MDETATSRGSRSLTFDLGDVDFTQVVLSYDRESDTLMLHLFGRKQPGVSIPITDDFMVRFDRSRNRVVGIQIEHFLSSYVREHPTMLAALHAAELRGITRAEVAEFEDQLPAEDRKRAAVDAIIAELAEAGAAAD